MSEMPTFNTKLSMFPPLCSNWPLLILMAVQMTGAPAPHGAGESISGALVHHRIRMPLAIDTSVAPDTPAIVLTEDLLTRWLAVRQGLHNFYASHPADSLKKVYQFSAGGGVIPLRRQERAYDFVALAKHEPVVDSIFAVHHFAPTLYMPMWMTM